MEPESGYYTGDTTPGKPGRSRPDALKFASNRTEYAMKVAKPKHESLRERAAKIAEKVAELKRPRNDNTPKRQKEARRKWIEGEHLDRVRVALLMLADGVERGTLTATLAGLVKAQAGALVGQLTAMLRTRLDFSGGYYAIHDTGEYADQSPTAVELRRFVETAKGDEFRAREARAAAVRKVRDMEARLRFTPIPGFFPTPEGVAKVVADLAEIRPGHRLLEPSAGIGTLLEWLGLWPDKPAAAPACDVCEIHAELRAVCEAKGFNVVGWDFLALPPCRAYDRVVMNPPFEAGQDADHVRHAYEFLKPGGRLVAVVSSGLFSRQDAKATSFRGWLASVGGVKVDLPESSFRDSFNPTGVRAAAVAIERK